LKNYEVIQEKSAFKSMWAFTEDCAIYVPAKPPKMIWSEDESSTQPKPQPGKRKSRSMSQSQKSINGGDIGDDGSVKSLGGTEEMVEYEEFSDGGKSRLSSGHFFPPGKEMPVKKEDQLKLTNILDLVRSNAETARVISETTTKNLMTTENNATTTNEIAGIAKDVASVTSKNLTLTEKCSEIVEKMDLRMESTFKVWNRIFEDRLRERIGGRGGRGIVVVEGITSVAATDHCMAVSCFDFAIFLMLGRWNARSDMTSNMFSTEWPNNIKSSASKFGRVNNIHRDFMEVEMA
jgi:hypothetical protein